MERYRILPITECYGGMEHRLYPVVLFGPEDAVLVDCGYPDSLPLIEDAMAGLGLPDAPVVTGGQQEVLDYYGLNAGGIARAAYELCRR